MVFRRAFAEDIVSLIQLLAPPLTTFNSAAKSCAADWSSKFELDEFNIFKAILGEATK